MRRHLLPQTGCTAYSEHVSCPVQSQLTQGAAQVHESRRQQRRWSMAMSVAGDFTDEPEEFAFPRGALSPQTADRREC